MNSAGSGFGLLLLMAILFIAFIVSASRALRRAREKREKLIGDLGEALAQGITITIKIRDGREESSAGAPDLAAGGRPTSAAST